jgi:methionyl-tRNA formyltransferase
MGAAIPLLTVTDINAPETYTWIKSKKPDVIFCFGWSSLIGINTLSLPPLGIIGFHPAELPKNRGRHPLIWALALGLERTAATFFYMDDGVDSGDILSQVLVPIDYEDDARSLYDKVTSTAMVQIERFLPLLGTNDSPRLAQGHVCTNEWRKRGPQDGRIDFRMTSRAIYNLVRALAKPYVGAHISLGGKEIKVWKVREVVIGRNNLEPGKVLAADTEGVLVKCGENAVMVAEHEFKKIPKPGTYL